MRRFHVTLTNVERIFAALGGAMPDLPFVGADTFWRVTPTGDWSADSDLGRTYGENYLRRTAAGRPAPELGWIVASMIAGGRFSGIESGFIAAVSRCLTRGLRYDREQLRAAIWAHDNADDLEVQRPIIEPDGALSNTTTVGDEQRRPQELAREQNVEGSDPHDDDVSIDHAGNRVLVGVDGDDLTGRDSDVGQDIGDDAKKPQSLGTQCCGYEC